MGSAFDCRQTNEALSIELERILDNVRNVSFGLQPALPRFRWSPAAAANHRQRRGFRRPLASPEVFGKSKPVVIDSYSSRKSKKRLPRWLLLLLLGLAAGAGGTIYVQEQVLPPRLSAGESATMRDALGTAQAEGTRLRAELEATAGRLDAAQAEARRLGGELADNQQAVARARDDVDFLIGALPADPRGSAVEIRAARFRAGRGVLDYEIALAAGRGRTAAAVVELVVTGDGGRAGPGTVTLNPMPLPATATAVLRGRAALPDGFAPQQCAIRVLDRPGGQLLGMRLINVR